PGELGFLSAGLSMSPCPFRCRSNGRARGVRDRNRTGSLEFVKGRRPRSDGMKHCLYGCPTMNSQFEQGAVVIQMKQSEIKPAQGYTPVAKTLHWLVVLVLTVQYVVAWSMPHIGRNTVPDTLINLHFSFGMVILFLLVLRLLWRWTHAEPSSPP